MKITLHDDVVNGLHDFDREAFSTLNVEGVNEAPDFEDIVNGILRKFIDREIAIKF